MNRRQLIVVWISWIVISLLCFKISLAQQVSESNGEKLSMIDARKHSASEFQAALKTLSQHHPGFSEEEIAAMIYKAFA